MKRLLTTFNNQKFSRKLLQLSLIISLIPVLLLGTFAFYRTRQLLTERETAAITRALTKEANTIDSRLNSSLEALKLITWNDGIRSVLSKSYSSNYEIYLVYRDVIDPTFAAIPTVNTDIQSITVYTDGILNPHGDSVRKLSEIVNEPWYDLAYDNTAPTFYYDSNSGDLLLFSQIYYRYSTLRNIVCITINTDQLFHSLDTIFDSPYHLSLEDNTNNNSLIYNFSSVTTDKSYLTKENTLKTVPWTITLNRPVSLVLQKTREMVYTIVFIILLCLCMIFTAAFLMSKAIVSPLEALVKNVKQIETGNFSLSVSQSYNDEIGDLIQAFKSMIKRLRHLIDEVLKSKIKQQEFEMKALQAQINPHFLYNSLSMINSKAILAGQDSISQMSQLLSTFYRTTLNKGNNTITVKDELANTLSYAKIQRLMHSNSFDIIYEVDDGALEHEMPNLLLQPLVENAILHGLDYKTTPGKGILTIMFNKKEDNLIFKVMDNGKGMSEDQCKQILTSTSNGYGIHNVHQRIQLYCGEDYGLSYKSQQGLGTSVILTVKIIDRH